MKTTEYTAKLFNKNGEEYTKFIIGTRVINSKIEKLIIALGAQCTKQTKTANTYELKGNRINIVMLF